MFVSDTIVLTVDWLKKYYLKIWGFCFVLKYGSWLISKGRKPLRIEKVNMHCTQKYHIKYYDFIFFKYMDESQKHLKFIVFF